MEIAEGVWLGLKTPQGVLLAECGAELEEAVLEEVMLANLDGISFTGPGGEALSLADHLREIEDGLLWTSQELGVSLSLPLELKDMVQCTATDDLLTLSLYGVQLFSISRAGSPGEKDIDLGNAQFQASYYSDTPQVYTDPDYGWRIEFPAELFLENGGLSWKEEDTDDCLNGLYANYIHAGDSGFSIYHLYVYVLEENAPDPGGFHPEYIVEVYRGNGIRMVTIADDLDERMAEDGVSQALQDAIRQVCLITPDGQTHYLWQ